MDEVTVTCLTLWAAARWPCQDCQSDRLQTGNPRCAYLVKPLGVKPAFGHVFWGWVLLLLRCLYYFAVCAEESISMNYRVLASTSAGGSYWTLILSSWTNLVISDTSSGHWLCWGASSFLGFHGIAHKLPFIAGLSCFLWFFYMKKLGQLKWCQGEQKLISTRSLCYFPCPSYTLQHHETFPG